ncbi:MAG: hypothetical protein AAGD22_12825 [Verrucomicrobiota bacterium]
MISEIQSSLRCGGSGRTPSRTFVVGRTNVVGAGERVACHYRRGRGKGATWDEVTIGDLGNSGCVVGAYTEKGRFCNGEAAGVG